ncbi:hypothetical protein [Streptomyces sp. NPDC004065]|uniref:hypothetical protein n=1 Tax=Streptomyces sp. NPDC004065 TaxID=3364689 RepID=UPI00384AAD52
MGRRGERSLGRAAVHLVHPDQQHPPVLGRRDEIGRGLAAHVEGKRAAVRVPALGAEQVTDVLKTPEIGGRSRLAGRLGLTEQGERMKAAAYN